MNIQIETEGLDEKDIDTLKKVVDFYVLILRSKFYGIFESHHEAGHFVRFKKHQSCLGKDLDTFIEEMN